MVAKNHCLMKLRDRNGKSTIDLTEHLLGAVSEDEPYMKLGHLEKDRTLELMENALEELSIEQKQCVTLFYLEKNSYQAIAATTGFSVLKVKSYIQNGKRNLKILLDKKLQRK
jgi:RNA polymerase sigma factor (sigma-70 family)